MVRKLILSLLILSALSAKGSGDISETVYSCLYLNCGLSPYSTQQSGLGLLSAFKGHTGDLLENCKLLGGRVLYALSDKCSGPDVTDISHNGLYCFNSKHDGFLLLDANKSCAGTSRDIFLKKSDLSPPKGNMA